MVEGGGCAKATRHSQINFRQNTSVSEVPTTASSICDLVYDVQIQHLWSLSLVSFANCIDWQCWKGWRTTLFKQGNFIGVENQIKLCLRVLWNGCSCILKYGGYVSVLLGMQLAAVGTKDTYICVGFCSDNYQMGILNSSLWNSRYERGVVNDERLIPETAETEMEKERAVTRQGSFSGPWYFFYLLYSFGIYNSPPMF